MADEQLSATAVIEAPAEAVFDLLADPATHAAIDGTGWVRGSRHEGRLTEVGQVFRMAMHHDDHPDGDYQTVNQVVVLDRPTAICWKPGYDADDGTLRFGGWTWRYDLAPAGAGRTEVTLTYDWSAVDQATRDHIGFPPFGPDHLRNSLAHLAALATADRGA